MFFLSFFLCFVEASFYKESFSDSLASVFSLEVTSAVQAKLNGRVDLAFIIKIIGRLNKTIDTSTVKARSFELIGNHFSLFCLL
jgi:hypothetical protein